MDFDLNEEQRLLKESVERFMAERYDFARRRQFLAEQDGWKSRTVETLCGDGPAFASVRRK